MDTNNSQDNNDKFKKLSETSKSAFKCIGADLDQFGLELDTLARISLRDGVLRGILQGHEEEVRQEAIILVLKWFFRHTTEPQTFKSEITQSVWHTPRALANALKIAKLRYLEYLSKDANLMEPLDEGNGGWVLHPSDLLPHEWPESVTLEFIQKGIQMAVKLGCISPANACIGSLILVEQMPVAEVAKRLGVHRSAVYQQLRRVLKALPAVIDNIDPPPMA